MDLVAAKGGCARASLTTGSGRRDAIEGAEVRQIGRVGNFYAELSARCRTRICDMN
ncbi:protein of unknown function [Methylocaldum szegediense]|uniref:Uncharacterized protein n=1 Tax=Methylocaldum szegediense TaxID=73780 RepID=A0ABN8WX71_9GAMM|nr:protein of unknown function [Methylocaldum szegediense]